MGGEAGMSRILKIVLWLIGLFVLIILIQYPMQDSMDSWESWSLPLAGKTIVLDPGHGGADGGAEAQMRHRKKRSR